MSERCCTRGRMRIAGIALVGLALLALSQAAEGASPSPSPVTDSAGRTIEIPREPMRVMAAGPPAAVLLYALAPDKLVGWPAELGPAAKAMLPEKYAALPVVGRLTGREQSIPAATLVALHLDLILDVGTVDQRYGALADETQKATHVPYLLFDGSLAKTVETLRTLGRVLGETARADELARMAEGLLAEAAAEAKGGPRPRVYYARARGGLATPRGEAMTAEILKAAGAENVAAALAGGGQADVTLEQIRAWAPDAVIAYDARIYAAILHDPSWQALPAVAARRVYLAPDVPFSWIDEPPGINRLIGLPWLRGVLTKGAPPADMTSLARDFYRRFYHVELSRERIEALLAPAAAEKD